MISITSLNPMGNNGFIARMEGNDDSFAADTPGEALTGLMNTLKANQ